MTVKVQLIGNRSGEYFIHAPENYPICIACGVSIVHIKEAVEIEAEGIEDLPQSILFPKPVLCRMCVEISNVLKTEYESFEDLLEATNAEERVRVREETFRKEKAERAADFRSERGKKAARARADKKRTTKADDRNDDGDDEDSSES